MMWELWVEYVIGNPELFKTADLGCPDPGAPGFSWPNAQLQNDGGCIRRR
jgi:hypothetical protein